MGRIEQGCADRTSPLVGTNHTIRRVNNPPLTPVDMGVPPCRGPPSDSPVEETLTDLTRGVDQDRA